MSSVVERLTRDLVHNRLGDIMRLVVETNAGASARMELRVQPATLSLEIGRGRRRLELHAFIVGPDHDTLNELCELIDDAATFMGTTPAALGIQL
ncbi:MULTISPECIES: hypothetical protein [unclassified Halomonas]|uniref:hypothetical protein n=1 Tax=unclassified Halomonas TaxID=2609666 RepID=UPI00209D6B1C|nr:MULTISPECIES: hypothetical protein [unclassified Halomonas]MCP1313007.1 hypothetical protein [Halomonas sp. 707D7]MCP1326093.1 hypothetical protein [Halomonas sp. 707D4]